LLIGEGAGIGPTLFIAERVRELAAPRADTPSAPVGLTPSQVLSPPMPWRPLVLLGSTGLPFPFRPRPSVIVVPGIPTGVIACMPLLEEWSVASRQASTLDLPGCFEGPVTALADAWLSSLTSSELAEVEIFPNGSASMAQEAGKLAEHYCVVYTPS
jgi:dihydroorotate dehydrogenase electron transfer subunit